MLGELVVGIFPDRASVIRLAGMSSPSRTASGTTGGATSSPTRSAIDAVAELKEVGRSLLMAN